jgi:nuclear pore complex protein Nup214
MSCMVFPLLIVYFCFIVVEWSVKGKFVAVARKNVLTILSSRFKECLCMSLSFKSLLDDSDVNCSAKG